MNSEEVIKETNNNDIKKNTKKKGFYCLSCKKLFTRVDGFKYHMKLKNRTCSARTKINFSNTKPLVKRERTKGCTNHDHIPWITCQENAQEQLLHFKMPNAKKRFLKKTPFMYMQPPTDKDVVFAKKQSSLAMAD